LILVINFLTGITIKRNIFFIIIDLLLKKEKIKK
jgi:hypothetical protein